VTEFLLSNLLELLKDIRLRYPIVGMGPSSQLGETFGSS